MRSLDRWIPECDDQLGRRLDRRVQPEYPAVPGVTLLTDRLARQGDADSARRRTLNSKTGFTQVVPGLIVIWTTRSVTVSRIARRSGE